MEVSDGSQALGNCANRCDKAVLTHEFGASTAYQERTLILTRISRPPRIRLSSSAFTASADSVSFSVIERSSCPWTRHQAGMSCITPGSVATISRTVPGGSPLTLSWVLITGRGHSNPRASNVSSSDMPFCVDVYLAEGRDGELDFLAARLCNGNVDLFRVAALAVSGQDSCCQI